MKTLYFITLLLVVSIGGVIYLTASYQTPPDPALVATTDPSSSAAAAADPAIAIAATSVASDVIAPTMPASLSSPSPAVSDVGAPTAPAAPSNLAVDAVSPTQANLSWSAPADTSGIVGYAVYRNFSEIGVTPDTIFSDVNYSSQYSYSYNVTSYDKAGLQSAFSPTFTIEGDLGTPPAESSTPASASTSALALAPPPASSPPLVAQVPTPTSKPTPTTPASTPAASTKAAAACGSGGSCTAAQVAAHSTRSDCWVYLSQINKAYNITAYVANPSLHPGGDVIAPHCGTDIYSYFLGTAGGHKHSANALNNVLQAYYIGPMA
jgi:hypothetical protein